MDGARRGQQVRRLAIADDAEAARPRQAAAPARRRRHGAPRPAGFVTSRILWRSASSSSSLGRRRSRSQSAAPLQTGQDFAVSPRYAEGRCGRLAEALVIDRPTAQPAPANGSVMRRNVKFSTACRMFFALVLLSEIADAQDNPPAAYQPPLFRTVEEQRPPEAAGESRRQAHRRRRFRALQLPVAHRLARRHFGRDRHRRLRAGAARLHGGGPPLRRNPARPGARRGGRRGHRPPPRREDAARCPHDAALFPHHGPLRRGRYQHARHRLRRQRCPAAASAW